MKISTRTSLTALVLGALIGCSTPSHNTEDKSMTTQRERAVALLESLESGDPGPVSYINPDKYIQHNLAVADGLDGFAAVVQNAPPGGFKAKVVRAFADGDFVVAHTQYDFFGPRSGSTSSDSRMA